MSEILNDRDVLLQAAPDRVLPTTGNKALLLASSSTIFKTGSSGATPGSITFTAQLLGISGTAMFSASDGSALSVIGNVATLAYADMLTDATTVLCTVTDGALFTASQSVQKVADGSVGVSSATIYAYQRAASAPVGSPGAATYTVATGTITTPSTDALANGWTKSIPSGAGTLWVSKVIVSGTTATIAIFAGSWSAAAAMAQDGASPNQVGMARVYQWSSTAPASPTVASTYTWATGATTATGAWAAAVPANPGTPGVKLWIATAPVSDVAAAATTSVSWSGVTVAAWTQNGAAGTQAATPTVYQWAATIPAGPTGAATYTWATATFGVAPASWALTPGTSPSPGYTLWAAKVALVDGAASTTTAFNWTSAGITAAGYAGTAGGAGTNGTRTAVLDMYRWSAAAPTTFPAGSSTYTWATGQFTAPATLNSWSLTPPAPVAGQTLWIARMVYADTSTTATTSITWTAAAALSLAAAGSNGANGQRVGALEVYKWAATTPTTYPSGTSTYTWATGAFTAPSVPNGWSLTPGASTPGYSLYAISTTVSDALTTTTSTATWASTTVYVVGAAGAAGGNGSPGADGSSYRTGYSAVNGGVGALSISPSTVNAYGYPSTGTWGETNAWQSTVPAISSGQSLWQIDGIYNPNTSIIVWTAPYLSSLKVGSLSAISANIGSVTAGNIDGVTITGGVVQTGYSGARITLNESGSNNLRTYDSSGNVVCSIGGSAGTVTAIYTGNLNPAVSGYITGSSTSVPGVYGSSSAGPGIYGISSSRFGVYGFSNGSGIEAVRGEATNGNAHGVRGMAKFNSSSSIAQGLVGAVNGYDFYADGAGVNGPFTGAHDVLYLNGDEVELGDIVVDIECISRFGWSNTIFSVARSSVAMQRAALGVISTLQGPLSGIIPAAFTEEISYVVTDPELGDETPRRAVSPEYEALKMLYQCATANAVGEGQMNVVGEGGDISAGDLIVTSSVPGKGMRQADDLVRSYTVARAREACTFTAGEIKQIACIYLCG